MIEDEKIIEMFFRRSEQGIRELDIKYGILLTMRPLDERGAWAVKSKKEYVLDEKGERVKLPSGRYKTRKVDLVDWNNQENAEVGGRHGLTLPMPIWRETTARSVSTTAAMNGKG